MPSGTILKVVQKKANSYFCHEILFFSCYSNFISALRMTVQVSVQAGSVGVTYKDSETNSSINVKLNGFSGQKEQAQTANVSFATFATMPCILEQLESW